MEDCIVYLVWQLRQSGFEVRFTWPNLLYISWKHHEGAYLANKNPIVQAMIPEPTVTTVGNPTQNRRAVDYEPPASFIQNMDRPGPGRAQKEGVAKGNVLADLWTM